MGVANISELSKKKKFYSQTGTGFLHARGSVFDPRRCRIIRDSVVVSVSSLNDHLSVVSQKLLVGSHKAFYCKFAAFIEQPIASACLQNSYSPSDLPTTTCRKPQLTSFSASPRRRRRCSRGDDVRYE